MVETLDEIRTRASSSKFDNHSTLMDGEGEVRVKY
jgi:hypothetical protein